MDGDHLALRYNEKIFIFLWFWTLFVLLATSANLVYWIICSIPAVRCMVRVVVFVSDDRSSIVICVSRKCSSHSSRTSRPHRASRRARDRGSAAVRLRRRRAT